ncbi:MAG TPA: BTAD domain-containing putative transcriptional regulator [Solirubrobacter sp.]|nr:BTAD domain-containing putative transcriptional regulator [Solirubrobacter sp.]
MERDGRAIEVAGARLQALLARLALDAGRPVPAGALADAVWGADLPADEQHALQSLVSRLRRALTDPGAIAPAPGGYRLALDPDAVDAHRFARLAGEGAAALRAGDRPTAAALLREALALWSGPFPPLEDARIAALADLAEADGGAGVLAELEAAVAAHPLHERLAARHIAALYAAGRQADALAAYERVRERLADELGAAPSPELQAAHLAVLRGDDARPARRASNLRAPVTSFVGREQEIERIGALLGYTRLVTLVGPGGAGKTRLASEALARWVDRVPGGVWMVELAPLTAEVELVPAVLAALGLRETALLERQPRDGLARLVDALADREAILALDNCEHVIAGAAQLADRLLGACPDLRIVATSREPLAIAGENLVPVAPLEDDPAVRLFADRAAAASPGFVVDGYAREICRRLDGLPLAIELAAARLRTLPVEQLAARLDDRFRLLTGGSRAALPRHRTLRAVVDWSWGLLDEPERRLARRLAVFSSGATEDSAAAVCDVPDAFDGLAALADRSLLQRVGDRYRMLETIREYALEKLDEAGELEATRAAHARWFAALAERAEPELRGPDQAEWFRRLRAEHDDLIAALRWLADSGDARAALRLTVSLLWFWMLSGAPDEARAWIDVAVAVPGEADPVDRLIAEGIQEIARAVADHGAGGDALSELAERLERTDVRDRPLLALARPMLALFAGQSSFAETRLAETLEHPDPWVRAVATLMRAQLAENSGDQEHMRADLEQAAERFGAVGDMWGRAMTLSSLAGTLMLVDDLDGAEAALDEAMEFLASLEGSSGTSLMRIRLADVRLRRGDLDGARRLAREAAEDTGLQRGENVYVRATVARLALLAGDIAELRDVVADAAARLARQGPQRPEQGHEKAMVEALQAALALEEGDVPAAEARVAEALATAAGTRDLPAVATVGVVRAAVSLRAGRPEDAGQELGAAAVLRGAEDRANPEVARLLAAVPAAAYERGLALDRDAALARFSRAAGVGA